jgi:lysophospholipase L1-like esterase
MVIAGDSLTARYSNVVATRNWQQANAFWLQVNTLLNGRFDIVNNAGVAGDVIDDLITRFQTDVLNYANQASYLGLCIGVNDALLSQADVDAAVAKKIALVKSALSSGFSVFLIAQPLKNGLTGEQQFYHNQFNNRLADWGEKTNNVLFINPWHVVVDTSTAANYEDGLWNPAYIQTNPHPNEAGAILVAGEIKKVIESSVPQHYRLPDAIWYTAGINGDYDNAVKNGGMFGSAGTTGTGASGSVADLWNVSRLNGAGIAATCSKVARTDGQPGEWQRIDLASAGADTDVIEMQQVMTLSDLNIAVGDEVYALIELNSSASSGYLSKVECVIEQLKVTTAIAFYIATGYVGGYNNTNARTAYAAADNDCSVNGVLRTDKFTIDAETDTMKFNIRVGTSTGGAGQVDIGRIVLRKIYND